MRFLPLLLLAWSGGLAPAPPPAPAGMAETRTFDVEELLEELRAWNKRFDEGLAEFDPESHSGLRSLLSDIERAFDDQPERREDVVRTLLDLQGIALTRRHGENPFGPPDATVKRLLRMTDRSLKRMRTREIDRWLTREVLVLTVHGDARRAAAARLFADQDSPEAVIAIQTCLTSGNEMLQRVALETLTGWDEESVHLLMVRRLLNATQPGARPETRLAERHFRAVRPAKGSRSEARLSHFVKLGVLATDWREASLAASVSRGLEAEQAVPSLIEGLEHWIERGEERGGTLRIAHELADALQERSGRSLGLHPDRWRLWWKAVRSGDIQLFEASSDPRAAPTTAEFFGLRPKSDRITFVLDKSGSMETAFGPVTDAGSGAAHTRFKEATQQLLRFLEDLGEKARFNVILFSDETSIWRTRLQPATRPNLKGVRNWLQTRRPSGGTMLRDGVHRAMRVGRAGKFDPEDLEADTVIVLCDGSTTDGKGWVQPFLARFNDQARVKFHCVQVGPAGDGTLQLLAEETDGDYVHIER